MNLAVEITLGVVAISHLPERMTRIPEAALRCFRRALVNAIMHTGDIWARAGRGLPLQQVLECGEVRIGLTHGHGGLL